MRPINATTGAFSSVFTTAALGVGASPYTILYSFAGSTNFAPASTTSMLTVNPATPTVTWAPPADISFGTAPVGRARRHGLGAGLVQLYAACRHHPLGGPGAGLVGDLHPNRQDRLHHRTRIDDPQRADGDAHLQRAVRADDDLRHGHDHPLRADRRRYVHSFGQRRDHPGRRDPECSDRPRDRRHSPRSSRPRRWASARRPTRSPTATPGPRA